MTRHKPPIVTLLTDFGLQDEYVGVLKGVVLRYAPDVRLVDISHLVPPQSISSASHLLSRYYKYFPSHTVHLVVVDPGVGSDRQILAIAGDSQYFIGPDNGVFTPIITSAASLAIYKVEISTLPQNIVSSTFQGRDIMAPLAGQLAAGLDIESIGPRISPEHCLRLDRASCSRLAETLEGQVIHTDSFGNLCTNIRRQDVEDFADGREITIEVTTNLFVALAKTYNAQTKGMILALYDSHDHLEIAINQGNAAKQLSLGAGAKIIISFR